MALLDLQGMEAPATELAGNSSTSKHSCHGGSELSVTLCSDSDLSVLLCQN